jgi:hypothetical protein
VLDTVTGTYHMESKTVRDGRILSSPAHPSVYSDMFTVAAELARSGDYSLLGGPFAVPESYMRPNTIGDSYTAPPEFGGQLCRECAVVVERLCIEIPLEMKGQKRPIYGGFAHQLDLDVKPSINELAKSAKEGCKMCAFILGMLQHVSYRLEQHIRRTGSRDFPIQIIGIPGEYYQLMVWFRDPNDWALQKRTKGFEMLATFPVDPRKFPEFSRHIGVRLSHHFLSTDSLRFFRLWLDDCVNNHATCNAYKGRKLRLPTRLIDVGDALSEPHLVELDPTSEADYVTLSYCWGPSWNLRTTKDNLDAHKTGIPMHTLSPTLRHAVLLTRHLGFRYLWADSLCIVQDSRDDWDVESIRMADIYQNSVFTIAVPRARSTLEGILPDVSERQLPLRIAIDGLQTPLFVDAVPLDWSTCVEEDALSDRAWVLQERVLSCRTVFFGSQQMFWECKTRRASQHQYSNLVGEADLIPVESAYNKVPPPTAADLVALHALNSDQKRDYITWYNTISVYSTKSLTVAADKLPALAGIARTFGGVNDIYVSGTWLNDWMGGLFWRPATTKGMKSPTGMQQQRAPSWSWASLDGPVVFPFSSPNYDFCDELRRGILEVEEVISAIPRDATATGSARLNSQQSGQAPAPGSDSKGKELENLTSTIHSPTEMQPQQQLEQNDQLDSGGNGESKQATEITIDVSAYPMHAQGQMLAELLAVSYATSDFLGKVTDISLTLRGYAEWVALRSSRNIGMTPDPPSTLNGWVGTYDDFTGNWSYVLDRDGTGVCMCLRLILCSNGRKCFALLLCQRSDGKSWERVGTGVADSRMVDFTRLARASRETVVVR